MKKASGLIALVMALVLACGSLAITASAAFSHPDNIHTLAGGADQASAVKVAVGETVYGTAAAGTTAYYKFSSSKIQNVNLSVKSSAAVSVKVYANDPSLPVYSIDSVTDNSAAPATMACDIAYYHVVITNASEAEAEFSFTATTESMPASPVCNINHTELKIVAQGKAQLKISDLNIPDINYFWEVQDNEATLDIDERDYIKVAQDGTVTVAANSSVFNKDLTAKVQAVLYYNGMRRTRTCTVTAVPHNIFLDPYYGTSENNLLTLAKGEKIFISYSTNYEGAEVSVTSSNNSCIEIKEVAGNKITVEGKNYGEANIVFSIDGTTIKRTMKVKVPANYFAVKGVQFEKDAVTVRMGNVAALNYTIAVTPEGGAPSNPNVTFTTANPEIATVDAKGRITPVAIGETTVTITTESGNHTDTIKVTVAEELPNWLMLLVAPLRIIINFFALIFGN